MEKKNTIFTPHTIIGATFYLYLMGLILLCGGCSAQAEPETLESDSPTFTMESQASYPTLNAITNNPTSTFSDERESLKIMEYGASGTSRDAFGHYQTEMTLEAGRQYSLLIHVHNDADGELGEDGIAKDVQFVLSNPITVDGDASLSVLLTASNTTPLITGSSISVHSDEKVCLSFCDSSGEPYPVKSYDYLMRDYTKLATVNVADGNMATITGNVGSLWPGYTGESGAYIYLWFHVEAVSAD